jgi:hypothetical protein
MRSRIFSLVLLAYSALAADVNGKWRADSTLPRGDKVNEFLDITASGSQLRGTFTDTFGGKHELRDGKLDGERISFWLPWGKEKCVATGVARDGLLQLELVTPESTRNITARRAN